MIRGLVSAVRTLSILPVCGRDADDLSASLVWFPVVGAGLGVLIAGSSLLLQLVFPDWEMLQALLLLLLQTVLTGAMHLDGMADGADAMFSLSDKEKKLAIMKDSRLGTYGVLALFFALTLKWLLFSRLLEMGGAAVLMVAMVFARTAQVELAVTLPYARVNTGTARAFVESARLRHRVGAWIIATVLGLCIGPIGLYAVPVVMFVCLGLRRFFMARLGGVTGDLLGATSEVVELILLLAGSAWYNAASKPVAVWHFWEGLV